MTGNEYVAQLEWQVENQQRIIRGLEYEIEQLKIERDAAQCKTIVVCANWIHDGVRWSCNNCGKSADYWSMSTAQHCGDHCPNCGAKMDA